MASLNIVSLLENNPITKLSNTYQSRLLTKLKESFTEDEQQMFVTSFYCYLNCSKTDFVIDLDNIWKWIGFATKQKAKILLEKQFKIDIDYQLLSIAQVKQKEHARGGTNKEIFMLTVKAFKSFCLKAGTSKADQIHDYYLKLEETLHEVIEEESDELKKQLENKQEQFKKQLKNKQEQLKNKQEELNKHITSSVIEKEKLREKTILQQFPDNKQCIYYGMIDNTNDKNEKLIKFGCSNFLKNRVMQHKSTFTNFRLVNAFHVDNKTFIENSIKNHTELKNVRRSLLLNKKSQTELLAIDDISLDKLDEIINKVIKNVEYSPENYSRLLEENHRLKIEIIKMTPKTNVTRSNSKVILTSNYTPPDEVSDPDLLLTTNAIDNIELDLLGFPERVRKFEKEKDGRYCVDKIFYNKLTGTRQEVWNGTVYRTSGLLTKKDFVVGNNGRIVSKIKHDESTLHNRLPKPNCKIGLQ
jgi:hypothetical protein